MSDETIEVTIEVTRSQLQDALSAINAREHELNQDDQRDRSLELTNVWAQLYREGRDGFEEGMKR
jgi:CRISPR/Cas system CSM-associated protein Csm2 small subunit